MHSHKGTQLQDGESIIARTAAAIVGLEIDTLRIARSGVLVAEVNVVAQVEPDFGLDAGA